MAENTKLNKIRNTRIELVKTILPALISTSKISTEEQLVTRAYIFADEVIKQSLVLSDAQLLTLITK